MHEPSDADLAALIRRLDLEDKVRLLTGKDSWSLHSMPQIGLRSIVVSDGPVGVRGSIWDERSPSANFPSPTALAASWDPKVVRSVGNALGTEARRKGIDVVLAPTINLHRTPYGGRHFEAFSEDPHLTAELATEYVRGIQEHGVGATVKHYVANDSETDRFTVDVQVDERTLRELYLAAFEGPIRDGKSWLVMSAYNAINGTTASENALLTTPLNDEWEFDGVVISDWTAVRSLEAARRDQDLAMPGPHGAWGDTLVAAVRAGDVDEAAIDRKVARILRLAARVGALEGFGPVRGNPDVTPARKVARDAAIAGAVLLKNNDLLPLAAAPISIAVIGEGAVDARTQGGGSATVIPMNVVSPLDGLHSRFPEADIAWARGASVQTRPSELPKGSYETPTGKPGMLVRYLTQDGRELLVERREASSIVSFDGASLASRSAVIEMSFRYRMPDEPTTRLAVTGLCDYEVLVDGALVASGSVRTEPGDDPATAILTPPYEVIDVRSESAHIDVVVRFTPVAGGIPDALAFAVGVPPRPADPDRLIQEAAELAAAREIAVVVVSTSPEVESEGFDRTDLQLPGRQDDLVRAVAAANTRTIVVVNTGAPVVLPWRHDVSAILAVWFPGQEFGDALADILSGDREPGGRLPVSWPDQEPDVPVSQVAPVDGALPYDEGIHIGYRAWLRNGTTPAFPFGSGLGFTTSRIQSVDLPLRVKRDGTFTVRTTVTNVGARSGKIVVQLYAERGESAIERPARWLVGFASAVLEPGEKRVVPIDVSWRRLAHWTPRGWDLEPGPYRIIAALSADDASSTSATIAVE